MKTFMINEKDNNILFIDDNLKKEVVVSFEEIKKNDFNLSVNQYVQEEKEKIKIEPIELQTLARKSFLNKLKAELEFDKTICDMEKYDFSIYLEQIQDVINSFATKINLEREE